MTNGPAIRSLSDRELLSRTKELVRREQALTLDVIAHLEEVNRRRLYAAEGYSSLFAYATKALRYSEPAASQRIAAMRLARDLPEAREAMASGEIPLTTAAAIQQFIQREERGSGGEKSTMTAQAKANLLSECKGRSTREVERKLADAASTPVAARPDRTRAISDGCSEIQFTADAEGMRLLDRAREVRGGSIAEVIAWALRVALDRHDPLRKAERSIERRARAKVAETRASRNSQEIQALPIQCNATQAPELPDSGDSPDSPEMNKVLEEVPPFPEAQAVALSPDPVKGHDSRHVPASVRDAVVARAGGRCDKARPQAHPNGASRR